MINLIKASIGEIPVMHVVQDELHEKALPTVIYYHGFNGEKISSLTLAYKMAEKGFRVVMPDSIYHGDRGTSMSQTDLELAFWDVVLTNIHELAYIREYLLDHAYSIEDRIGVGGTSMGAITTYGALAAYDWIKSAAALMGSAYMLDYAAALIKHFNEMNERQITKEEATEVAERLRVYDLTLQPEKLGERPMFIWHGEDDDVVPFAYSPAFYDAVQDRYTNKASIRFIREKGRAHHVSRLAMEETADWFERYL